METILAKLRTLFGWLLVAIGAVIGLVFGPILAITPPRTMNSIFEGFAMLSFGLVFARVGLMVLTRKKQRFGQRLDYYGNDLFYTSPISMEEATSLGAYLYEQGFFKGNKKSFQLSRAANTYQFRMVIAKNFEPQAKNHAAYRQVVSDLSRTVFPGAEVEMHLCDAKFKTLRIVGRDLA